MGGHFTINRRHSIFRLGIVVTLGVAGAAFGIWNLGHYSNAWLNADGLTFDDGTVILEPNKWVGNSFALASYINVGPQLMHGNWIVLLYRYDCEDCQRAVPCYLALARSASDVPNAPSIALIEIPPYAPAGQELVSSSDKSVMKGRLTKDRDWFASTPVAVRLNSGVVDAVAESDAAENPALVPMTTR